MKSLKILFFCIFISVNILAQQNNYHSPLNIPLIVTGSFGELRTNSFHAGVDFSTNQKTGEPVFAIDDGYISRIGVSPVGYGNVLYIDHPNGISSVYGHLREFSPQIQQWVRAKQYEQKSFRMNIYPDPQQFKVKKGDIIAYSGNTGSSGGPHLHFEMRKTQGQFPVNPFDYNFDVADNTPPYVENIYVYPLGDSSHVMKSSDHKKFELVFYDGKYHLKGKSTINVYGKIGFGVDAIDYFDNNWSKCGINRLEYRVDGELIHRFCIDELDYSAMRYFNSHIDYREFCKNKRRVHKIFTDAANKLAIYSDSKNRGIVNFSEEKMYTVQIILADKHNNVSEIEFKIQSGSPIKHHQKEYTKMFNYKHENFFATSDFSIQLPAGALYRDLKFNYQKAQAPDGSFSALHSVYPECTPLHLPAQISIKLNETVDEQLCDKLLVALYNPKTRKMTAVGGLYDRNTQSMSLETRNFGNLCVVADTVAPTITSLDIRNNYIMQTDRIRFKIRDDFSGIKSYSGKINGQWVLFTYDAKSNMLEYVFDEYMKRQNVNKVEIEIVDQKLNVAFYSTTFRL